MYIHDIHEWHTSMIYKQIYHVYTSCDMSYAYVIKSVTCIHDIPSWRTYMTYHIICHLYTWYHTSCVYVMYVNVITGRVLMTYAYDISWWHTLMLDGRIHQWHIVWHMPWHTLMTVHLMTYPNRAQTPRIQDNRYMSGRCRIYAYVIEYVIKCTHH